MSSATSVISAILYCVPSFLCMITIPWLHFIRKKRPSGFKGATVLAKVTRSYNVTLQFASILGMILFMVAPAGDSLGNSIIAFLAGTGNEILILLLYLSDLEILEIFSSLDSRITRTFLRRFTIIYCLCMIVPIFFSTYRSYFYLINDVNTFNHLRLPNLVILSLADLVSIGLDCIQNLIMLQKLQELCKFWKKDLGPFKTTARIIKGCLLLDLLDFLMYLLEYYLESSGKLSQLNANGMLTLVTGLAGLHCGLQIILMKRLGGHVFAKSEEDSLFVQSISNAPTATASVGVASS